MKKFTFMIIGVSVFFIGLGGIVKQVGARFKSDAHVLKTVQQIRIENGGEEKSKSVKSFTIHGKSKKHVIIGGIKENEQSASMPFTLQVPSTQFNRTLSFPRQPSSEPIPHGEEFPRVQQDEDVLIFKRQSLEEKSDEIEAPKVRVFINKEKESK